MPEQKEKQTERLMLHFGTAGPIELEIWDEELEEATHISTEYPKNQNHSEDVTRALRRAGYKLVEVEDA